jgi:hypothetical protein
MAYINNNAVKSRSNILGVTGSAAYYQPISPYMSGGVKSGIDGMWRSAEAELVALAAAQPALIIM